MKSTPVSCERRDELIAQEGVKALGGNTDPGVYHCTIWGFPGAESDEDGEYPFVVRDEVWYGSNGKPRSCEHWVPA